MNIEAYISSGILEAYAMGELDARERAEVEQNVMRYPEIRAALQEIEETQERMLMETAIQPKAHVKEKLFAQVQTPKTEARIVSMPPAQPSSKIWQWVAAAAVIVGITTSYLAVNYHNKWKDAETQMTDLLAQNQRMAQDYNQVNKRLERIEDDLHVMENPAFLRVLMNGTANAPDAQAAVYWNPTSQQAFLSVQNLKTLAQENQYQLWAIVDGKPVDMGVFDGGENAALLAMKPVAGAAAFAVTVEPRGGKESPSLETMQVIGQLAKG